MGGQSYRDQIDITPAEFWAMFKTLKEMPTTSGVSPGTFTEIFQDLAKSTGDIVCMTVSKALSATYGSAEIAQKTVIEENPNLNIELVDSKSAVGALGFVVLEAARAAHEGKSLAEVIKVAQDLVPKVKYISAFDTLKYLIKGGRAPKTAIIGDFLQVKPIIGLVNGTGLIDSLGKERGKKKAMQKLVEMVSKYMDTNQPLHIIVHYTDNIDDGHELKGMVTSSYNCAEIYMTDLTPVMTVHTGPSLGLSFYS